MQDSNNSQNNAQQNRDLSDPMASANQHPTTPGAQAARPQGKRKIWPWILLGIAVALLLIIGVFTSCSMLASSIDRIAQHDNGSIYSDHAYSGQDDRYGDRSGATKAYAYDTILAILDAKPGNVENKEGYEGAFIVGKESNITPGLYYFSGSQDEAGEIHIFDPVKQQPRSSSDRNTNRNTNRYTVRASISYIGNYFVELDEGQLVVFLPPDGNLTMHLAPKSPIVTDNPLQSGCYRVGIDIPEGTYNASLGSQLELQAASQEGLDPCVNVTNNVSFDEDTETLEYSIVGGSTTSVKVKNGQFLELYAANATLVDP